MIHPTRHVPVRGLSRARRLKTFVVKSKCRYGCEGGRIERLQTGHLSELGSTAAPFCRETMQEQCILHGRVRNENAGEKHVSSKHRGGRGRVNSTAAATADLA